MSEPTTPAEKTRKINPPQFASTVWPKDSVVALGEKQYVQSQEEVYTQNVYLDDKLIGQITSWLRTPHTTIKGTRYRKDLAERRVWSKDSWGSRSNWDERWLAIQGVLENHQSK